VIALDTNVLVAAHRSDAPEHAVCLGLVSELAVGERPWGLFWPSLYEFLRVVTHHRVFMPPTPLPLALAALDDLLAAGPVRVLSETPRHAAVLRQVLAESPATGNLVHDAHLVALAVEHGVHEIVSFDEDFRRFPQVRARRPR
jgi:toxin-antitoxin system PIN domain toxin